MSVDNDEIEERRAENTCSRCLNKEDKKTCNICGKELGGEIVNEGFEEALRRDREKTKLKEVKDG